MISMKSAFLPCARSAAHHPQPVRDLQGDVQNENGGTQGGVCRRSMTSDPGRRRGQACLTGAMCPRISGAATPGRRIGAAAWSVRLREEEEPGVVCGAMAPKLWRQPPGGGGSRRYPSGSGRIEPSGYRVKASNPQSAGAFRRKKRRHKGGRRRAAVICIRPREEVGPLQFRCYLP